ncbi:MAG: putative membrane protein [Candidatus Woesearchaeota archaeon]|jgi:uncharacterized membrane protein
MKYRLLGVLFLCILFLTTSVCAAKIQGAIYDQELEPIKKAVVRINTTPEQVRVSQYGGYHFIVSPGDYELTAEFTQNGITKTIAQEYVSLKTEADITKDLFLFTDFDFNQEFENSGWQQFRLWLSQNQELLLLLIALIAVSAASYSAVHFYRTKKLAKGTIESTAVQVLAKPSEDVSVEKPSTFEQGDDRIKQKIIDLLKKKQGGMTQKDIRKQFDLSEAKISMIITSMESQGVVKKTRHGRKNIIEQQKADPQK